MGDKEFLYIAALQDFAQSVAYLAESIQDQVKNQNANFKDATANTKEYATQMMEMAEKLELIAEESSETKSNTEKILDIVKGIKKEKKKGIWDKLGAKDKSKNIADGIKTIVLMAGGILAIGAAFKLVGEVDFASVTALSIALPLMALAFQKIQETGMTPKEAALGSLSLILMSAGILGSAALLQFVPSIGIGQIITSIGVAVSMGIVLYAMSMVADNLNAKEVGTLYAIAGVMPVMALGILASAYLLQSVPEIDFMSVVKTTAAIALSIGITGLALVALEKLGMTIRTAVMGIIIMPAIALGIALSSQVLRLGNYEEGNYPSFDWALGVGTAIAIFGLASIPLGFIAITGIGALAIVAGIGMTILVAAGIAATSQVLRLGDYTGGPSLEWAAVTGLSMTAFGLASVALGFIAITGIGALAIYAGIDMMVSVAEGIVEVSKVLKGGKYKGGPTKEWAAGVGLSIVHFANALDEMSPNIFERLLFGDTIDKNIASIVKLAETLPRIGIAVGKDSSMYTGGPRKEWAEGVGTSISAFANALGEMSPNIFERLLFGDTVDQNIESVVKLAGTLPRIGLAVGQDDSMYRGGPSEAWAKGVGGSLTAFATAIATLDDELDLEDMNTWTVSIIPLAQVMALYGLALSKGKYENYPSKEWAEGVGTFIKAFTEMNGLKTNRGMSDQLMTLAETYVKLAASITVLGRAMQGLPAAPDLTGIYGGIVTLSLIDEEKLSDTLDTLNDKQEEFKKVMDTLRATSQVQINDSTFAFNKDKKEVKTVTPKGQTTVATPQAKVTPTVNVNKTTKAKPEKDEVTSLLKQAINLLSQISNATNDVADNTSVKISSSDIISH